ncbi:hypothetical protein [Couchioplanes caeruleus]|uniref:hypothetical protein n=1 Tax=Couchioplanes caeruleus TaxID=56438 RepID=UPI001B7FF9D7|nr:hypothetical protein [Couchioplanes caeruleus]
MVDDQQQPAGDERVRGGAQPAELLTLFGAQGERAHLSPSPTLPRGARPRI